MKRHLVHEGAHQQDAASSGLEQIILCERVGDGVRIESAPFIPYANRDAGGRRVVEGRELDVDSLARVEAVAVFDGVDDRLAYRNADPMKGLVVESRLTPDVIAHDLDEVQHVERAVKVEANGVAAGHQPSTRL